jgi:hypothetical protein
VRGFHDVVLRGNATSGPRRRSRAARTTSHEVSRGRACVHAFRPQWAYARRVALSSA